MQVSVIRNVKKFSLKAAPMENKIDRKYIGSAIDDLISLLGVKEEIPHEIISKSLRSGNIKECVQNLASYLGLPISINLIISNTFESRQLSKTNRAGRGMGGITAQVSIPSYVPAYGSPGLQNFPITVTVSENCVDHPETFAGTMAHELSHILLHSLFHKEKDNEFYTDLVALILGFSRVMKIGRKVIDIKSGLFTTKTLTTTYGYLTDQLFDFAYSRVDSIRKENINSKKQLIKKLNKYGRQISSYKRELARFNRYMEYIDKTKKKNFNGEDAWQIIKFHQLSYTDHVNAVMKTNDEKLREVTAFCESLIHYTPRNLSLLRKFEEEIDGLIIYLNKESNLLTNDIRILRKYVNFLHKVKWNL
jgi:hypothetical protein